MKMDENTVLSTVSAQMSVAPVGNTIDQLGRAVNAAKMICNAECLPENYRGKVADVAIAIDMANRMGVSSMMVMQNLYVVKGKPSWSGQACKALVEGTQRFRNIRHVYTGTRGTDDRGCYITATYADDGAAAEGPEVTIKMAKAEGWYGKTGSKWQTMPELMLVYRAYAFFARTFCPEALMGVAVQSEAEDVAPERRTVPDVL
jgi:hypothetical protein